MTSGVGARGDTPGVLNAMEETLLEFEDRHPGHGIRKSEEIRREFSVPAARYYQLLLELVRRPEVIASHARVAGRVRRLEDARVERRVARARIRQGA